MNWYAFHARLRQEPGLYRRRLPTRRNTRPIPRDRGSGLGSLHIGRLVMAQTRTLNQDNIQTTAGKNATEAVDYFGGSLGR